MKNLKKLMCMLLALAMVFALCACGSSAPAESAAPSEAPAESEAPADEAVDYSSMTIDELKPLIQTVTEGKLTIATSPDFAPYEFYAIDADGNPQMAGFDIGMAQYIADFLGLEAEIIPMDFDGVLNELAAKSVDIGAAGLSPDESRKDAMDFSDIYYLGGQSFVTVEGKEDLFPTLADANKAEYSIGAQNGSIQMDLANENTPDADIISLVKVTDIVAELIGGKLDGAFIETAVAENYAKSYPQLKIIHDVPYEEAGSAFGISKGNEALLAAVNLAIAAANEDGFLESAVAEANELSTGEIIEGLLPDAQG